MMARVTAMEVTLIGLEVYADACEIEDRVFDLTDFDAFPSMCHEIYYKNGDGRGAADFFWGGGFRNGLHNHGDGDGYSGGAEGSGSGGRGNDGIPYLDVPALDPL